jgi:hypothetical protein
VAEIINFETVLLVLSHKLSQKTLTYSNRSPLSDVVFCPCKGNTFCNRKPLFFVAGLWDSKFKTLINLGEFRMPWVIALFVKSDKNQIKFKLKSFEFIKLS